jgi:ribonuclease J
VKLSFFGGVNEIGGNKFLLAYRDTQVFLDFGKSFERENKFFDFPLLQPFYIPDLKKIHAIPDLKGLYKDSSDAPEVDGVLVTHPHVDHFGYISLLNGQVPIHIGEGAKTIIDIRSECYRAGWDRRLTHLSFETFRTGREGEVGEVAYRPFSVDHSIPASYGFILHVGGKTVVYTGDLRRHGTQRSLTERFLRAIEEETVDVMLCEGTNIAPARQTASIRGFEREYTRRMGTAAPKRVETPCAAEADVERELKRLIEDAEGLVLVETSPADIDRIRTVWKAAQATGRTLILDSRQAYLAYELDARDASVQNLPCPQDSGVYLSRIRDRDGATEGVEARTKWRPQYQQTLIERCDQVYLGPEGRAAIRRQAGDYVLCTDNATQKLLELKEGPPIPCHFVLSKSEPFNEEMVIAFDRLLHWLAAYGVTQYHEIHVSGHCWRSDLKTLIEEAKPSILVPVHTEHPALMARLARRAVNEVRIPQFQGSIEV